MSIQLLQFTMILVTAAALAMLIAAVRFGSWEKVLRSIDDLPVRSRDIFTLGGGAGPQMAVSLPIYWNDSSQWSASSECAN